MRKIIIMWILTCSLSQVKAQENISNQDVESLFKLTLFLDHSWFSNSNTSIDSLFQEFMRMTVIVEQITETSFYKTYKFYAVRAKNICLYNSIASSFHSTWDINDTFILCVNEHTKTSYRILGFEGNDFLDFMHEYIGNYYYICSSQQNKQHISVREFLNETYVKGVDFKCLYKGLRAKKRNPCKFPCLDRGLKSVSIQ